MDAPKNAKKRKITDKTLPPNITDVAPDSAMYQDLLDMERKLDWTMMRKRIEIQEALAKPIKVTRTLRVFVSHTVSGQPWQIANAGLSDAPDFTTGQGIPAWKMKVEGRLLDSNVSRLNKGPPRKFSSFLKSMIIELDRDTSLYPESNIIEWHRPPNQPPQDGFEISRRGDVSTQARIILHLEQIPERFKVAPELANILQIREESRVGVITSMWNYIKVNGLQDKGDRRIIRLDDKLRALFGTDSVLFHHIAEIVNRFLLPPDPIVIHHAIRTDELEDEDGRTSRMQAFDIDIDIDDHGLKSKMSSVLISLTPEAGKNIAALDDEIAQLAQSIRNAKLKRDFLQSFVKDPRAFIHTWVASQARDLDVILSGERGVREEDLRRSDFFKLPWVEEAVAVHEGMRVAGALTHLQGGGSSGH